MITAEDMTFEPRDFTIWAVTCKREIAEANNDPVLSSLESINDVREGAVVYRCAVSQEVRD